MRIKDINFDLLNLNQQSKILDVGCGTGTILIPLWENGYQAIGVDPQLDELFKVLDNSDSLAKFKVFVTCARGEDLPFDSNIFDIVTCSEVLEHVQSPELILSEIHRVLKPGGTLCITVPGYLTERIFGLMHPKWFEYSGHKNIFRKGKLVSMLRDCGFEPFSLKGKRGFYTYFWFFHCLVRTKYNCLGQPLEHRRLTNLLFSFWRLLEKLMLKPYLEGILNRFLPKSILIYCEAL